MKRISNDKNFGDVSKITTSGLEHAMVISGTRLINDESYVTSMAKLTLEDFYRWEYQGGKLEFREVLRKEFGSNNIYDDPTSPHYFQTPEDIEDQLEDFNYVGSRCHY